MAGLCPPADASPAPSRMPAHGSGPMWIVLRHRVGLVPTTRRRSPGALRTKHRERLSAHGSVDHHWRGHLIVTQRVDEGDGLPAPNETRPISLTPRGARLLSRTMLVLAAVSSINTSRAGSSMPCARIQRRRALATLACCRSAACRLLARKTARNPQIPANPNIFKHTMSPRRVMVQRVLGSAIKEPIVASWPPGSTPAHKGCTFSHWGRPLACEARPLRIIRSAMSQL